MFDLFCVLVALGAAGLAWHVVEVFTAEPPEPGDHLSIRSVLADAADKKELDV